MSRTRSLASLSSLRWILTLPRAHPVAAVLSFGLGLVAVGFSTWLPLVVGHVIDGLAHHRPDVIAGGAISLFAVGLGQFTCNSLRRAAGGRLGAHVEYGLRERTMSHLLRLDQASLERAGTGALLSLTNSDISAVSSYLALGLALSMSDLLTVLIAAAHLVLLSPQLSLIALVLCPPLAWLAWRYDAQGNLLSRRIQRLTGELTATLEEDAVGIKVIKSFRLERHRRAQFDRHAMLLQAENQEAAQLRARFGPRLWLLPQLGLVAMLWYGGAQVANGTITLGTLIAAISYMTMIAGSLTGLSSLAGMRQRAIAGAERIREFLGTQPAIIDHPDVSALPVPPGRTGAHLALRGVVLERQGINEPVLNRVDLDIAPGMWVALAGQTGAGKSTLAALLNRGLDPTDGAVLVDGYNIREVSLSSLRAQVVVLPSDPVIFAGTPRSNVRFGSPTATDADVRQALWIAAALDFAKDLPGGIDGPIGERGQSLSGGQRQRIALARAVLSQPRLLVLDGGLSQLDPLTEQLVLDRLAASLGNTTVLMIGPRRGGSRRWDHLFELKNGHLVSQDDALSRTGHAALTSSQEPCR